MPDDLDSLHRFVAARITHNREWGKHCRANRYPFQPIDGTALQKRALRIESALLTAIERRGHALGHEKGSLQVWMEVGGECVVLSVYEYCRQRRIPLTPKELAAPENVRSDRKWRQVVESTGKLAVSARVIRGPSSAKPRWIEDAEPLEAMLGEVVLGIEQLAKECAEQRAEIDRRDREWRERWEEQERERGRLIAKDRDWDEVRQLAADWREARLIRRFVATVADHIRSQEDPDRHGERWLAWASQRVRALDPFGEDAVPMIEAMLAGEGLHRPRYGEDDEY